MRNPFGDVTGPVELRVHDQSLPPDRGTRFFEIDAHEQKKTVLGLLRQLGKPFGIFATGFQVVNGTGTDHGKEAFVLAFDQVMHFFSCPSDQCFLLGRASNVLT